jgi:RNA polymerase primary sigma factor
MTKALYVFVLMRVRRFVYLSALVIIWYATFFLSPVSSWIRGHLSGKGVTQESTKTRSSIAHSRINWTSGGFVQTEGMPEQLKELIETGQTRGYVLYDELDGLLPADSEVVAELDKALSVLASHGIEVLDEPRTEDSVPDESFFDQDEDFADSTRLKMYLREVLMVPHLTVDEERELAKTVKEASNVLPTPDVEIAPRLRAVGGTGRTYYGDGMADASQGFSHGLAEEAAKRLIEANLWIALGTAMHFLNRGLKPLDLIQEGNVGLMRAVRQYDYRSRYKFSTYATWWMRRAIQAAITRNG